MCQGQSTSCAVILVRHEAVPLRRPHRRRHASSTPALASRHTVHAGHIAGGQPNATHTAGVAGRGCRPLHSAPGQTAGGCELGVTPVSSCAGVRHETADIALLDARTPGGDVYICAVCCVVVDLEGRWCCRQLRWGSSQPGAFAQASRRHEGRGCRMRERGVGPACLHVHGVQVTGQIHCVCPFDIRIHCIHAHARADTPSASRSAAAGGALLALC